MYSMNQTPQASVELEGSTGSPCNYISRKLCLKIYVYILCPFFEYFNPRCDTESLLEIKNAKKKAIFS